MADKERHGDTRPKPTTKAPYHLAVNYTVFGKQHSAGTWVAMESTTAQGTLNLTQPAGSADAAACALLMAQAYAKAGILSNWTATGWVLSDANKREIAIGQFQTPIAGAANINAPQFNSHSATVTLTGKGRQAANTLVSVRTGKWETVLFTGYCDPTFWAAKRQVPTVEAHIGNFYSQWLGSFAAQPSSQPASPLLLPCTVYGEEIDYHTYLSTDINNYVEKRQGV